MDELNKLKLEYIAELGVQYKNLITFLEKLPVNQQFKLNGFMNLDQGLMWFQKAIEIIQVETQKAPDRQKEPESKNIEEINVKDTQTIN